ncbi:MAG: DNA alkylation repair protein [Chitinophagaceae bacterium]
MKKDTLQNEAIIPKNNKGKITPKPDGSKLLLTSKERTSKLPTDISADRFIKKLKTYSSQEEAKKYLRYFKTSEGQYGEGDIFMGVRMGQVFALAKEFIDMPTNEIEKLLESHIHEVRAGDL